jgi:LacI family transcriptional regulator
MSNRVTIKDIAEKAGVSPGTVDRVLHNRGNVSPLVRQKVLKVIEELGYEPNIIASTLAYNRTVRVGALMPDYRNDLYWEKQANGMLKAYQAVKHFGIELEAFYFDLFDPQSFLEKAHALLQNPPEALLFPPIFFKEANLLLDQCQKIGIPAVLVNTDLDHEQVMAYIGQDSYQSGVLAGKLLHFGMKEPEKALVLNLDKETINAKHLLDKEHGLRDYFAGIPEKGFQVLRQDFEAFEQPNALRELILDLLQTHPDVTGIFVSNSRAYKVLQALEGHAYRKVKIVGFDLLPPNLDYLKQEKISFLINQNPEHQGYLGLMNIVNHFIYKRSAERIQHLPLDIVVTENADYYLQRNLEFQSLG